MCLCSLSLHLLVLHRFVYLCSSWTPARHLAFVQQPRPASTTINPFSQRTNDKTAPDTDSATNSSKRGIHILSPSISNLACHRIVRLYAAKSQAGARSAVWPQMHHNRRFEQHERRNQARVCFKRVECLHAALAAATEWPRRSRRCSAQLHAHRNHTSTPDQRSQACERKAGFARTSERDRWHGESQRRSHHLCKCTSMHSIHARRRGKQRSSERAIDSDGRRQSTRQHEEGRCSVLTAAAVWRICSR